ncbi:hypothetical protein JR316_0009866 [Psilocybe cubensis]|uniref:Uncharacterized protein n=2 Tax=Psilocybe cubensis TaxID=181762 RepID=A0A8H7XPQ9_PSICU|nr:hypothetical protein JR316_0009866 [Psilocybe cubensis]KAH9477640.1 hypothetical protein JR316_0009866 [Psilocybe cubensis]
MVNLDIVPAISLIAASVSEFNAFPLSPGFDIKKVAAQALALPTHSWEYGTASEALLELYNPHLTVFGATPFPVPALNVSAVVGLDYAAQKVRFGTGYSALFKDDGAAGDPASLGVSAVMLGKVNSTFAWAANQTVTGLLADVPRYSNGAISHRFSVAELWADNVYMVPPFLAYYAADKGDNALLQEAVRQLSLYRQVLQPNATTGPNGLWMHIIGPESQDTGYWATGNAWAAAGISRVLATVIKAPGVTNEVWRQQAITQLTAYIKEIIDAAMVAPLDNGLIRNYVGDVSGGGNGFGEISGTSLLAATVYRMAVMQSTIFTRRYITWADNLRAAIAGRDVNENPHITSTGIATPAVNPLWWKDTNPFTKGSPEGQAFVVMMYAGWRDCIKAGRCTVDGSTEPDAIISKRSVQGRALHSGSLRRQLVHPGSN